MKLNKTSAKVIRIMLAAFMLLCMAAMSVSVAGAATAATAPETTVVNTDATSAVKPAATPDAATRDSSVDSANGSIPTGENGVAVWAFAVITFIVAATGVACFAHRRKENR